MKYMRTINQPVSEGKSNIVTDLGNDVFNLFPAVVGNPNYDAFLVQAELTDKQVHALTPDVWYDFPTQKEEA